MKLPTWGITCLELTGDNESCNTKNIHESNISLTTLEKFEVMTRREARDGWLGFFSDISLVLSDEVHLLNDPHRAALEVVVSKLKMLSWSKEMTSSPLANVCFMAVSATIPNFEDLTKMYQKIWRREEVSEASHKKKCNHEKGVLRTICIAPLKALV
ncbi:hypothetical protein IEQ34_001671 [Dendrobium chrysotoxum]|uniref:DEAD/DEAH-box helicase domain-containing protein n=1 Tax=Dendrobium chrysotoxum TaxID=161865 RepID=A0AAV7HPW0_DENCH|nr:hypothetical protein IEQ34_001671 [Dendrobium chrysotoxum]